MTKFCQTKSLRRNKRAVTPALSSIILTCAVIIMVMVALFFSNNYLQTTLSQNEYKANKQFMLTEGLQIDDVAWTLGRTQTSIFSSRYGTVSFEPEAITYTFEVKSGGTWETIGNYTSGIVLFNMPTSIFTLGDGYFERIFPSNGSFLQQGSTAPVSQVFVSQKNSLQRGSGLRVIAAPTVRLLNSKISTIYEQQNYLKFYLPILTKGDNLYLTQSVTQTGSSILKVARTGATQIRVNATIPITAQAIGYDLGDLNSTSSFFRFESQSVTYPSTGLLPTPSTVELYIANVTISIGLAT